MLQGSEYKHISVLLRESMEALNIKPDGVYVDCTAGGGGHSAAIASRLSPNGTLISIDKDDSALGKCMLRREECFSNINWMPVKSDYGDIDDVLDSMKIKRVDGILADLGVSSYQLDNADRGFSHAFIIVHYSIKSNKNETFSLIQVNGFLCDFFDKKHKKNFSRLQRCIFYLELYFVTDNIISDISFLL